MFTFRLLYLECVKHTSVERDSFLEFRNYLTGVLLAIIFIALGFRRLKHGKKCHLSKKRIALIAFWCAITLTFVIAIMLRFPATIIYTREADWAFIFSLAPYSVLTATIALATLSASITWFVAFPRRTK